AVADAVRDLCGGERRTGTQKWVIDQFATLGVVQDWPPHQLDRLLCGVIEFLLLRSAHNELWGWGIPDRRAFARLSEPGRVLFPHVPAGFVLIPVVRSRQHDPALVPNDLL